MEAKSSTFLEVFDTWEDAITWIDSIRAQFQDDWSMIECRVNYIGMRYRAGITYVKAQLEMF